MPEYMSFEEVLGQLKLSEEQLKGLVSEGELRAFRDEDKMKFRKEDVQALAQSMQQEQPRVARPSKGGPGAQEGTILDESPSEQAPPLETSVPSLDFGGKAPPVERGEDVALPDMGSSGELVPPEGTGVPEADFGATEGTIIEPPADEGKGTSVTQEMPIEGSDLVVHPSDEAEEGEESAETFVEDSSQLAGTQDVGAEGEASAAVEEEAPAEAPAGRRAARAEAEAAPAAPGPHPIMTVFLFLGTAAMGLVGYILVDLIRLTVTPDATPPARLCQSLMEKLAGKGNKAK